MNTYLATQLSGDVVQGTIEGMQDSYDATAAIIAYWTDLTLTSATGTYLDFMGCVAGYPRPLVDDDFYGLNTFHFGDVADWEEISETTGLGDVYNAGTGGQLGSIYPSVSSVMPDSWYRLVIPMMAILGFYGLSVYSIDMVCSVVMALAGGISYTLSYKTNGDLVITWAAEISYPCLTILNNAMEKYETSCVVTVVNG
jgi:hypothetical protein